MDVVICCYTTARWDLLLEAIAAATRQIRDDEQVIVVVDHNDELLERLREHFSGSPAPIIVANTGRQGLSDARNTGAAQARSEAVVFLDDDAVLVDGSLDAARAALGDDRIIALGGSVSPVWAGGAPAWFPDEFGWVVGCDYRGIAADGDAIRNPIGAAMIVRRAALEKIGGFSTRLGRVGALPAGCEETLMGIELTQTHPDTRIIRRTAFAVDHHVPQSRKQRSYFLSRCFHEGRSKAVLTDITGAGAALSSEVAFLAKTITSGVVRYLGQMVSGDVSALGRLTMMLLGVVVTVIGTAAGAIGGRIRGRDAVGDTAVRVSTPIAATDRVSVVIATVGRDSLVDTVHAALDLDHPDLEVIVVDNRPATGPTRTLLADITDSRLTIVDQPVPGISAARNAGIAAATGTVIAFTDDDAVPDRDWVRHIMSVFEADPTGTIGAVTGRVLSTDSPTEIQQWFEDAKIFDKGEVATVWAMEHRPQLDHLGAVGEHNIFFPYTAGQFGSGNNMAFATEVIGAVGGFDLRLGAGTPTRGGEDLDTFRTTALAGWTVFYQPNAVVRHYHRDNMADLRAQSYGYGTGMAAALTKLLVTGHARALLYRLPAGLRMLVSPNSEHQQQFGVEWPLRLRLLEAYGYLTGPLLFIRSHRRFGSAIREAHRS